MAIKVGAQHSKVLEASPLSIDKGIPNIIHYDTSQQIGAQTLKGGPGVDTLVIRLTPEEARLYKANLETALLQHAPGKTFNFAQVTDGAIKLKIKGIENVIFETEENESPNDHFQTPIDQSLKLVSEDLLNNDIDPEWRLNPQSITVMRGPQHGAIYVDPETGNITYTPEKGFEGIDYFTYTVEDTEGATPNEAVVAISVLPESEIVSSAIWPETFEPTIDAGMLPLYEGMDLRLMRQEVGEEPFAMTTEFDNGALTHTGGFTTTANDLAERSIPREITLDFAETAGTGPTYTIGNILVDEPGTYTYSLDSAPVGFEIGSSSGQLTYTGSLPLQNQDITVRVADSSDSDICNLKTFRNRWRSNSCWLFNCR